MRFNSLHSYLEYCFSDTEHVTDAMIIQAKQDWRKLYVSRYNNRYRETHLQISFRISKKEYQQLKKLSQEKGLKITTYSKRLVLDQVNGDTTFDIEPLKLLLLELTDLVEEAQHEKQTLQPSEILEFLKQMQHIV